MRIRNKIFLAILGVTIFSVGPVAVYFFGTVENVIISQSQNHAQASSQLLANRVRNIFLRNGGDLDAAKIEAKELAPIFTSGQFKGLEYVTVSMLLKSSAGEKMLEITPNEDTVDKSLVNTYTQLNWESSGIEKCISIDGDCFIAKTVSLYEQIPIASVLYSYSKDEALATIEDLKIITVIASFMATIIALFIGAYFSSRITRPIEELTRGVNEYGKGNNEIKVNINTRDELNTLGNSFNMMVQAIATQFEMIQKQKGELQEANESLKKSNKAYFRFVPKSFLKQLGKKTIEDVELGDQKSANFTILFSDIRGYTTLTEKMSPEDNTNFINAYFRTMIPCIEDNNGIIDKFIGDCIMAIFFTPKDSLKAAASMREKLQEYNAARKERGFVPIDTGTGIHTGQAMLATVGNSERLSTTVYSDAVNTAARLESLTKEMGAPILVSEEVLDAIEDVDQRKEVINLGSITVKGKKQPVKVYEYYAFEEQEQKQLKTKNRQLIETYKAKTEHSKQLLTDVSELRKQLPNYKVLN